MKLPVPDVRHKLLFNAVKQRLGEDSVILLPLTGPGYTNRLENCLNNDFMGL